MPLCYSWLTHGSLLHHYCCRRHPLKRLEMATKTPLPTVLHGCFGVRHTSLAAAADAAMDAAPELLLAGGGGAWFVGGAVERRRRAVLSRQPSPGAWDPAS